MTSISENPEFAEIRRLLTSTENADLQQARTLTREVLTRLTTVLVTTLSTRQQLMELIAFSKRQSEAILQLEREFTLIEHFKKVGKELGLDPDFVTQFIWLITAAAKDVQRVILNRETVFVKETLPDEILRKNLLSLTESVASSYDHYGDEFNATQLMRKYETGRVLDFARRVGTKGLYVDIGSANGSLTEKVAETGFDQTLGYDISPAMVDVANNRPGKKGTYTVADIFDGIPLDDNSVDFITANFGAASEVSQDIFPEISRVLKLGGVAYLSFYNNDALNNRWWQPGQTSIESVKNPLSDTIEVPIITPEGDVKTYICFARGTSIEEIEAKTEEHRLAILSVEGPGLLPSMLPPFFFRDEKRVQLAMDYERAHAPVGPFLGPYLNVVVQKNY